MTRPNFETSGREEKTMSRGRIPSQGWAKITLGISVLFAAGVLAYFWVASAPLQGIAVAAFLIIAGYWEYRRKMQDERVARRYEAEAEEQKRNRRQ